MPARVYYAADSPFRSRPDCVYVWQAEDDGFVHSGRSGLHAHPEHMRKDLGGRFSGYPNGRVLVLRDFRYFGPGARSLPESLPRLHHLVATLGQGHRVFPEGEDPATDAELKTLFRRLWRLRGTASPAEVAADTYDHVLSAEGRREALALAPAPCVPASSARKPPSARTRYPESKKRGSSPPAPGC